MTALLQREEEREQESSCKLNYTKFFAPKDHVTIGSPPTPTHNAAVCALTFINLVM